MTTTDHKCDCCHCDLGPSDGAGLDDSPELWCIPCITKGVELETQAERMGDWIWGNYPQHRAMMERLNETGREAT